MEVSMNFHHLKVFLAVVDSGNNLTRAGERLYTTQPAVSLAIKELEKEYGILLFDRLSRRLSLTGAGREFEKYARRIVSTVDDLEGAMRSWGESGCVRVGASMTIGSCLASGYVKAFLSARPDASINVSVFPSERLVAMIGKNALDLALLETAVDDPELTVEPFMTDVLVGIAPYAGKKKIESIPFGMLAKYNLIFREKGSGTRDLIDEEARRKGILLSPSWEVMSTSAILNAVADGIGFSVLPWRVAHEYVDLGKLSYFTFSDAELSRKLAVVHHRDKVLSPLAEAFIAIVKEDAAGRIPFS